MKYLYIGGKKIYVEDKVYQVLRKSYRHERYLEEDKRTHNVLNIESLKYELGSKCDVEEELELATMHRKLWLALETLDDDEFRFISALFFDGKKMNDLASETGISLSGAYKKRKRILKKLYCKIVQNDD